MDSIRIPMEKENIYERQLRLLYKRSDNLEIQKIKIRSKAIFKLIKREKFLDIGAGNGILTNYISKYFKETYCVEPNDVNVKMLKELNFKKIFNCGIEEFNTNEKFDLVLCSHVLYYIKREFWLDIITKMKGFLDDNGILVILLQSKDGEFQRFFNIFSGDKYNIDPIALNHELNTINLKTQIHHFKITFKTKDFKEFLEILYFLLLDRKENLKKKEELLIRYINSHFKRNGYYLLTQDIDMILIFK
ncbi:MAG: class I SAM-dependent methyltransferase [Promethearchaeota archaeon]